MFTSTFKLGGLTCKACVGLSKMKISRIAGIKNIWISDDKDEMRIESDRPVALEELREALFGTDYKVYA